MPTITKIHRTLPAMPAKKRVAAYARISVEKGRTANSLSAQVSHYSAYIQSRAEWEYAGVYVDSRETGTAKGGGRCATPHYTEDEIKAMSVTATNNLLTDKDSIIATFNSIRHEVFDTAALESERQAHRTEMSATAELMQSAIAQNARVAQDQSEYQRSYAGLVTRYETAKAHYEALTAQIADKQARGKSMAAFVATLAKQDGLLAEFDERLWHGLVEYVTVPVNGEPQFTFKG